VAEHRGQTTPYRLLVTRAQQDDMGPGVPLASGERRSSFVSAADPLDLYMFDVTQPSDVRILVEGSDWLDFRLLDRSGRTIGYGQRGVKLIQVLQPGTYHVAVTPELEEVATVIEPVAAHYRIRVLVRGLTTTGLSVGRGDWASVTVGSTVSLTTTTDPLPVGGKTRVEADFFDISSRSWVFRRYWDVAPGSTVAFTLDAVGEWRVRATFYGTQTSSPSRSDYRSITVSSVPAL
jgi:hypothetical protein